MGLVKAYKKTIKNPAAYLASILLMLIFLAGLAVTAYGGSPWDTMEQPALVITGEKVTIEKAYTEAELKLMDQISQNYSAKNEKIKTGFYQAAKGIDANTLLLAAGFNVASAANSNVQLTIGSGTLSDNPITRSFPNYVSTDRFYYSDITDGESSAPGTEILPLIAFEESDTVTNATYLTDAALKTCKPKWFIGQLDRSEFNGSSFVGGMDYIQVGAELGNAVTVLGKEYTRAELLLMERVTANYDYNTQNGAKSYFARGIPLASFVTNLADDAMIQIIPSDGEAKGRTVSVGEIKTDSNRYMLSYENAADQTAANAGTYTKDLLRVWGGKDGAYDNQSIKNVVEIKIKEIPSLYKHITYEKGTPEGNKYNIDAITGATLTVEGPGVTKSVPISVADIEKTGSDGIFKGAYTDLRADQSTDRIYEGVKVQYLLEGNINDNVELVSDRANVVFKNRVRQTVATIPWEDLKNAETPVILAWGTAYADGSSAIPFVYNLADGVNADLGNDDGCLKLVYNQSEFPDAGSNKKFNSVAYIYIEEEEPAPGYLHDKEPYNNTENVQYLISFGGGALGREVNLTTEELENLAKINPELTYKAEYGLSQTTFWYANEYSGLKLWDTLRYLGLDDSYKDDNDTKVTFTAWDNYKTQEQFTTKEIASPEMFYFYEKAINDIGTDRPDLDELIAPDNNSEFTEKDANGYPVKSGYPVLLATGVNAYPYVKDNSFDGYKSGLSNDGGPLRVVFGKRDYFHNNGTNQLQRVQDIFVGDPIRYSTHKYNNTNAGAYQEYSDDELAIEVILPDGTTETEVYSVGELEDLLYGLNNDGNELSKAEREERQEKGYYYYKNGGKGPTPIQDLFEGVNLWYLLSEAIGMPGQIGTISFNDGNPIPLERIKEPGHNSINNTDGLGAMIAFAKNGFPLVAGNDSPGYYGDDPDGITGIDGKVKAIKNSDGPLMFVMAQTEEQADATDLADKLDLNAAVKNLTKITVNLEADKYAHTGEYAHYAGQSVTFTGGVKNGSLSKTVGDIEKKQSYMVTDVYTVGGESIRYRGIDLLKLLNSADIGMSSQADDITIKNAAGKEKVINIQELIEGIGKKRVILAYGSNADTTALPGTGLSLVTDINSPGYDAAYKNSGGPLKLIIQNGSSDDCIENVTSIHVEAANITGWTHDYGAYASYKDLPALRISGSEVANPKTFTVGEIEALTNLMIQDVYKIGSSEAKIQGIKLWELIRDVVGLKNGVTKPSALVFFSEDGYKVDLTGEISRIISSGINDKPVLVAYGMNELPLVAGDDNLKRQPGFDPEKGNAFGPLRLVVNDNSGWCAKWLVNIVVGTGSFEKPELELDGFIVSGDNIQQPKGYSNDDLKVLGETKVEFNYVDSDSGAVTDNATGVSLKQVLEDAGLNMDYPYAVNIITTDGFTGGYKYDGTNKIQTYLNIPLSEVDGMNYFVAYQVNDAAIEDSDKNKVESNYRIYRNYSKTIGEFQIDGASTWLNRITNVVGVEIVDTVKNEVVFTINTKNYNSNPAVYTKAKEFTKNDLLAMPLSTVIYKYDGTGVTVKGVTLKELLAIVGIENQDSIISITTADNFQDSPKGTNLNNITLKNIDLQKYMVAFEVDGKAILDESDPDLKSYVRVYRNFDDGGSGAKGNRIKLANGVKIDPVYNWNIFNTNGTNVSGLRNIIPAKDGGAWLCSTGGLYHANADGVITKKYDTSNGLQAIFVYDAAEDTKGGLWVTQGFSYNYAEGDPNKGLCYISSDGTVTNYTKESTNNGLPHNFVQAVEVDSNGNVWIGSFGGLTKYSPANNTWKTYTTADGLPALSVNTITPDGKGGLWIGCYPDGPATEPYNFSGGYAYMNSAGKITAYKPEESEGTSNKLLADHWVRSIAVDNYGGVWVVRAGSYAELENVGGRVDYIGTDGTITHYTGKELIPELDELKTSSFNPEIRTVAVDAKGGLWFGTSGLGVYYCAEAKDIVDSFNFRHFDWPLQAIDNVYALTVLGSGNVYVGGSGGAAWRYFTEIKESGSNDPSTPVDPKFVGLTIEGAVTKPVQLTIDELKRLPSTAKIPSSYPFLNSEGTAKSIPVQGISLEWILNNVVSMNNNAKSITVTSEDGKYYREFMLDDEPSGVYYDFYNATDLSDDTEYPMALAYKESGKTFSEYPRLIMGMSDTMPEVPNGKPNAGLRYNGPNWVSDIKTIRVNTHNVESGEGTKGAYEDSPEETEEESLNSLPQFSGADQMNVTDKCTITSERDGSKKYTLSKGAADMIKDCDSDVVLTINPADKEEVFGVQIPTVVWQAAVNHKKDVYIMLNNKKGGAIVKLTDLVNGEMASGSALTIKLAPLVNDNSFSQTKKPWQELIGWPQKLEISYTANGKETTINKLSKYLEHLVPIPEGIKGAETVGVQYHAATNELTPLPTRFVMISGQRYAVLSSYSPGEVGVVNGKISFKDMAEHWAMDEVQTMASKLLINGKKENLFAPNASISRAEFSAMIDRALAILDQPIGDMKGVRNSDWFAQSMANMAANNLLSGDDKGMRPNDAISRAEMAAILKRAADLLEKITPESNLSSLDTFKDLKEIPEWAKKDLAWAAEQGIIGGDNQKRINSKANATRAEGALMIMRFMEKAGLLCR